MKKKDLRLFGYYNIIDFVYHLNNLMKLLPTKKIGSNYFLGGALTCSEISQIELKTRSFLY